MRHTTGVVGPWTVLLLVCVMGTTACPERTAPTLDGGGVDAGQVKDPDLGVDLPAPDVGGDTLTPHPDTWPDVLVPDVKLDAPVPDTGPPPPPSCPVAVGGAKHDVGYAIAVGGSGNSYITGTFEGTATFGSTTLTSKGKTDVFVAKLDSSCKILWATAAGSADEDRGLGIAVDSAGNSHVTGWFGGAATFGGKKLPSTGKSDVFVAKLDTSGAFKWAVAAGGGGGAAIDVDGAGNSYITGSWTTGSCPCPIAFVAKLDSAGTSKWAVSAGGWSMGSAIAVDSSGNSYVTGLFGHQSMVTMCGCTISYKATFGSTELSSKGPSDVFVTKLDHNGTFKWATSAGGFLPDEGSDIAVDTAGNSYVTGYHTDTATFGTTTLTNKGSSDVFIAKLDSSGKFTWAVSAGGNGEDYGRGIALDAQGNLLVTGGFTSFATFGSSTLIAWPLFFSGSGFVAKLDSAGTFKWAVAGGGVGNAIAVDGSGTGHVTGTFGSTAAFGGATLTSSGDSDVFVAKVDNSGK